MGHPLYGNHIVIIYVFHYIHIYSGNRLIRKSVQSGQIERKGFCALEILLFIRTSRRLIGTRIKKKL